MKVARTVKSKICTATKIQQLQQHLSAMPTMTCSAVGTVREPAGGWDLSPGWPIVGLYAPWELHPPGPWEQNAGDKPHSCRSSSRSSRAAANVAMWVWRYRLAENCVKKMILSYFQAIVTDHLHCAACPRQWGGTTFIHISTVHCSIFTWKDYAHFKLLHAVPVNQHFFIL